MTKKLVIVIPTYNEFGNIQNLFKVFGDVIHKLPKNWRCQLLFVDDNSPDGTAELIAAQAKKLHQKSTGLTSSQIVLLRHGDKQGLGKAYLVGMEYAYAQLKADAIGQFDADLSHDATRIPVMLCQLDLGFGMVIGSRYIAGGSIPANWGWYRKLLSLVGNNLVRFGLGHPEIHDWSTGFKVFTRSVYQKIRPQIADEEFFGYLIMIGMVHAAVLAKTKITEVPFAFIDRTYGESKLGVDYILHTLAYVARERIERLFKGRHIEINQATS